MTQFGVQEEHSSLFPNGEELHLISYPLTFMKVNSEFKSSVKDPY